MELVLDCRFHSRVFMIWPYLILGITVRVDPIGKGRNSLVKAKKQLPIYLALLIALVVVVSFALTPAHSDKSPRLVQSEVYDRKIQNLAQKLDLLPRGNRPDLIEYRRDVLFALMQDRSAPLDVIPYLSKPVFSCAPESLLIPRCFEAALKENDDIRMMRNLYPILLADSTYYRAPSTKEKLAKLASRVSKASCDRDVDKLLKFRILEKIEQLFRGSSKPELQLEIIDYMLAASKDYGSKDYSRQVRLRQQHAEYLERRQKTEQSEKPLQSAERRISHASNARDIRDLLLYFTKAVSESDLSREEKVTKLITVAERAVFRDLYLAAESPIDAAEKLVEGPDKSVDNVLLSRILVCRANSCLSQGNLEQARKVCKQLEQADLKDKPDALKHVKMTLARYALLCGDANKAIALLESIEAPPQDTRRLVFPGHCSSANEKLLLAQAYFELQNYDRVIEILRPIEADEANYNAKFYPELKSLLALTYYKTNQIENAENILSGKTQVSRAGYYHGFRGSGSRDRYLDYPLSYAGALVYKGDIADLCGDKLRANRYYSVARAMLDASDLCGAPIAKQIDKKVKSTSQFDFADEYWAKKAHAIVRVLRCDENARDDYKEHLKQLEYNEKREKLLAERKVKVEELRADPNASARLLLGAVDQLRSSYAFQFEDQFSRNPQYIDNANKLRFEAIEIFIKADHGEHKWSHFDVERVLSDLHEVESLVSIEDLDSYFRQIVRIAEASRRVEDHNDDEYDEYISDFIKGTTEYDDESNYLTPLPRERSSSRKGELGRIWQQEKANRR